MANDLLIKINADASNAKKEFDSIRKQTEELESTLKTVATVSGVAFAALTAEVYLSVKAFEDAEKTSTQLTNALQNQGIYTDELKASYQEFAAVVQAKTGIDNDAIIKAQAIAQSFLGQREITLELTNAIADLGASMGGDLNGAAEKIARTISTGTNAFARQGLDASRYALWCSDTWYEVDGAGINDATGTRYTAESEGAVEKTRLGIRYDQLLAFVIAAM